MAAKKLLTLVAVVGLTWWLLVSSGTISNTASLGRQRISGADLSLASHLPPLDFSPGRPHRDYYASDAALGFCAAHGMKVFSPGPGSVSGERKIYDLFMVNSELDFLEIRLRTLYEHVDYFVIVESPKTFQGNPKPLTILKAWETFAPYHDKMIYHELQFPDDWDPARTWDYEDLQRDAVLDQVLPGLTGAQSPRLGDVLIVADVDEIPRPEALLLLRTCAFSRRLTLSSRFYYYSFQFLHTGPEWPHPQATYYEGPSRTLKPTNLRNGDGGIPGLRGLEKSTVSNAGWHCSSCFATMDEFLNKMASFSHKWMNRDEFRDRRRIADAVRAGRDVWDRAVDTFVRVDYNEDIPAVLLEETERFGYMLSRDGETAGFTDYP